MQKYENIVLDLLHLLNAGLEPMMWEIFICTTTINVSDTEKGFSLPKCLNAGMKEKVLRLMFVNSNAFGEKNKAIKTFAMGKCRLVG